MDEAKSRILAAIWLFKHQNEIVTDCPLGTITKQACERRLKRLSHKPSRYAVNEFPLHPVGCSRCHHAEGVIPMQIEQEEDEFGDFTC